MARPGVYTPCICPICRSDVAFPTPDAPEVVHCTTCGHTFAQGLDTLGHDRIA